MRLLRLSRYRWRYEGGIIGWKAAWCFIGLSWARKVDLGRTDRPVLFELYLCLLPCLPIILKFKREERD